MSFGKHGIEFPTSYPIKIFMPHSVNGALLIEEVFSRHAVDPGKLQISTRSSRAGNYVAFTVSFFATSRSQLEAIYSDLNSDQRVLFTL